MLCVEARSPQQQEQTACPDSKQVLGEPQMREQKWSQGSKWRRWLLIPRTAGQRAVVPSGFHFGELDPSSEVLSAASAQKDVSY